MKSKESGCVFWITGLPGSGKSYIANALQHRLQNHFGLNVVLLDGDKLRQAFHNDDYSLVGRKKLATTYIKLAHLLAEQKVSAIVATVSLFDEVRKWGREHITDYIEVFVTADFNELKRRNKKDLYGSASSIYCESILGFKPEFPVNPDVCISNRFDGSVREEIEKIEKIYEDRVGLYRIS